MISIRNLKRSTVVTTNRAFSEWPEVFPNAACVVTLVDRLTNFSDVAEIRGPSFRLKEAQERRAVNVRQRNAKKGSPASV